MGAKTLMSVEAFDRLEEPDELSYELDEGELVVMTKPRPLHNRIVTNLEYDTREVEVWREAAQPQVVLQETDFLEAPGLLPEFRLRVGDLFA